MLHAPCRAAFWQGMLLCRCARPCKIWVLMLQGHVANLAAAVLSGECGMMLKGLGRVPAVLECMLLCVCEMKLAAV